MKINPSDQCLSLCLRALQVGVLPEVSSDSACRAIELITITLSDLLKRHQEPAIRLLKDCIDVGTKLEEDIDLVLDISPTVGQTSLANAGFEALAKQYDYLTERLNGLCVQLSSRKSKDPRTAGILRRAAEFEMAYLVRQAQLNARPFGDEEPCQAKDVNGPESNILLRDFFQSYISGLHGPLEITEWSEVPGGFGKETFLCTVRYPNGSVEDLVVRKSQPVPMVLHGSFLLEREYYLLQSLNKTNYPAPRPIDLGYEVPGSESTFFTMTRLPGKVLGSFLDNASVLPDNIFKQLAELLAKLHRIPLETFTDYFDMHDESATLTETVEARYRRNLKGWRDYIERVEHLPSPYITWLFYWLENNIPMDRRRSVLTHGDFSVHNILGENGEVTGVLDWYVPLECLLHIFFIVTLAFLPEN